MALIRMVSGVVLHLEDLCHTFEHSEIPMQILLDIPNSYLDVMHCDKEDFQREAKLAMAVKFFEMKRLSSGMAATLAGLDRVAFMAELPRFGVSLIDLSKDELADDVFNA